MSMPSLSELKLNSTRQNVEMLEDKDLKRKIIWKTKKYPGNDLHRSIIMLIPIWHQLFLKMCSKADKDT